MPVMDGREFLRQAIGRGISAPIVMMTAYGFTVDTCGGLHAGGGYRSLSARSNWDEL